jgi:hypothetical protein
VSAWRSDSLPVAIRPWVGDCTSIGLPCVLA